MRFFRSYKAFKWRWLYPFWLSFKELWRLRVSLSSGLWAMAKSEPSQANRRYPRYVSMDVKESLNAWNKKSIESGNNFWHCWEKAGIEAISGWKSQNSIHSRRIVFPFMLKRNRIVSQKETLRSLEKSFPGCFTNKWEADCISEMVERRFFFKVTGDSCVIGEPP